MVRDGQAGSAGRAALLALMLLAPALVAGCQGSGIDSTPVPPQRPAARPAADQPLAPESLAMKDRLAKLQAQLLSQGLLRQDTGATDAPFDARILAENFERIALYDEYTARGGAFVQGAVPSRLRRWESPVTMAVEFGATIPAAQRAKDRAEITGYARRLSRISGLPIRMAPVEAANYTVLVLNEGDRIGFADRLDALFPNIDAASRSSILTMGPSTYCLVFAYSTGSSPVYTRAVAVIRGEHPDLMRLSCIHEELAQGLGLANDSPTARPSIFNDDEEFALLTPMDELMLRMLYDPRLRPGMTPDEARPVVQQMATEILPPPPS
ncbi:DUF2927 domain-containing protein [Frigidibacter sp. MR17.24]|uniref:DUF2927 domain-containing protein n=1 Tax=Frigidibacter sp. MR17.24 TaxID=3127345 RepID=UPI003FA5C030